MEQKIIKLTEEQSNDMAQRAAALGISYETYLEKVIDAWLCSGEEMTITH